ncbi:unnamed protein product [Camellia sinensis]
MKKDRDRDRDRDQNRSSRSKRRREDRLIHGSNREDDGEDSSEESVNDEEDDDDYDGLATALVMATPFHLPVTAAQVGTYFVGQYFQVLHQQLDFVHQFYSEASTVLRIDGNSRETATAMLGMGILLCMKCILLYEMLYGYTPFRGKTRQKTFANILHKDLKFPGAISVSLSAKQLMYRLLHRDPKHRLGSREGANEIKRHPFFKGVNWPLVRCMCNLKGKFSISVEVKPKCGFLPDSRFISEENAIKKRITRFKMHQSLKLHQREISDTSEYDPLDMLSGSKERVHKAITALFCTPQNNFRVFLNDSLIFGGLGGGADITSCMIGNAFEDVLKCVIQADDGLRTTNFLQLVTEAVSRSGLLDRLLEVQKLDIFDIEGAIHAYYDVVSQPCIASFFDLDMKPLKKMEHYYELDQQIVSCYTQMVKRKNKVENAATIDAYARDPTVACLRYCLPFILLQQFVGFLQKRGTCSNCRNWFVITACLRQLTIVLSYASYLTNGYLDTVIDWIPGMNGIRLKDLPSFIRAIDIKVDFVLEVIDKAHKGSAIIFNTFDALEPDVLEALSTMYPPIYTIGPLQFLLDQFPQNHLNSVGSSLWKEEIECLSWLDSKEHNSVIYVNFGSITVMTPQHLIEFTWGLANSNQTFLWVIRPDLVIGDSAILLPDFVNETKERSLLASWCPQEQVLNHPSVGGFLTHCGWNSTLESICNGIPMLCWLFFVDQQTNCWSCCNQ